MHDLDDPESTAPAAVNGADNEPDETARSASGCKPDTGPKSRLLTLNDLDRRTKAAQRAFDMHDRLVAERGGADGMSVLRYSMTRSVAVLCAMIEDQQTRWLRGEPVEATAIATLLNARRREAEIVGVDPEPKDVTPSLASYLQAKKTPGGEQN